MSQGIPHDLMFVRPILRSASALDSTSIISTFHVRFPRILLPEGNTHRKVSKNGRSSRAVPIKTMISEVKSAPFIPWHWGRNQSGMQAKEECEALVFTPDYFADPYVDYHGNPATKAVSRETAWLEARDYAVEMAEAFAKAGYHKQVVNRLIEPFLYIDMLWTSTDWNNIMHLRDHQDAEPHFRDLAQLLRAALDSPINQVLKPGEWHMPYITKEDHAFAREYLGRQKAYTMRPSPEAITALLLKISAARCARISYKPFDGNASFDAEVERYRKLIESDAVHASPIEHQASPDSKQPYALYRKTKKGAENVWTQEQWDNPLLHGNLTGWVQLRKTVKNEWIPG